MSSSIHPVRRFASPLVAVILAGILFAASRQPSLPDREVDELAARFRFDRVPLPELPGRPTKGVRQVHPSLRRVSAMVSYVGAAAALADLDGDGLPNDLVHIDPRTDTVMVAPVPGTEGGRPGYAPFALDPSPLPFDPATMAPTGCLVGDFNEDGLADILVCYWGRSPILFLQQGDPTAVAVALTAKRFVPCELVAPFERWYTCAVTQADIDGDGHVDLVIGNYFADGARILDAGADGHEELPDSLSRAFNGGRKHFFLWSGGTGGSQPSAQFREADAGLDEEAARGWTFAVGAADLDGDLLPEIYFVMDFGPDRLLHNRSRPGKLEFGLLHGERTFTTPRSKVLGRDSFNGMGIDFGDLNGDGRLDIFVNNITGNFGLHESHFVWLNQADQMHRMRDGVAPYRDASEDLGLSRSGWCWEARLADFDNDGVLEVMQAAGATKGDVNRWPELHETALGNDQLSSHARFWQPWVPGDDIGGSDPTRFYVRGPDGRYHDVAGRIGLGEPTLSRGIAVADVDGDGRLDFVLANQWGPSFLFRNAAPNTGAFLGLNLRLPVGSSAATSLAVHPGRPPLSVPTRPAIGATARAFLPDGRVLVGQADGVTGHSGRRSPEVHFGLGKLEPGTKVKVEVRWRAADGQIREWASELAPGWHTVVLGEPNGGQP